MFQLAIQPTNDFIVRIVFTTDSPYIKKRFYNRQNEVVWNVGPALQTTWSSIVE